jgi:membrane protease YdiL (CAAX protease family)
MAGTALALHRVLRQSARKIERLVVPRRVTETIIVFVPAAVGAALLVVALPVWIGGVRTGVRDVPLDTLALIGIAQVVRATAEEIFFRGLLQTALMRLLWQAGVPQGRVAAGIAVVVVSTGFALEHVDPGLALGEQLGSLVWVFSMSVLLGVLLEASRNLYLVIAAHALVNLVLAGVVPMPLSPEGRLLIDPEAPALLALVFMFVGLVVSHRRRGF